MKYLLDTNVVSKLYDKAADGHEPVLGRIAALQEEDEADVGSICFTETVGGSRGIAFPRTQAAPSACPGLMG